VWSNPYNCHWEDNSLAISAYTHHNARIHYGYSHVKVILCTLQLSTPWMHLRQHAPNSSYLCVQELSLQPHRQLLIPTFISIPLYSIIENKVIDTVLIISAICNCLYVCPSWDGFIFPRTHRSLSHCIHRLSRFLNGYIKFHSGFILIFIDTVCIVDE
jgi:hypothetical protein